MADADRVALRYVKEVSYGVTPGGPPTFTDLRFTNESLQHQVTTVTSEEIRSDRQTVGLTRTEISGAGSMGFEMSYGAHDEFLESALLSAAWTAPVTMAAGPSMTISSNVVTRGTGDFVADGFLVGRFVKMENWDDAENNTIARISALTTTTLTLVGVTLTDDATAETDVVITQGGYIENGTTLNTYAIEREYTDLTSEFEILNGFAIDGLSLNVAAGEKITGSFEFVGAKGATATATAGDGTPTAAATNEIMAATDDVLRITEGNTAFGSTTFNITLANNLRARMEIGTLGAVSIGTGKVNVSGTLNAYYDETGADVFDKFVNFNSTDLSMVLQDQASSPNSYAIHMPGVKYTTGARSTPGESQDIILDLGIGAFRDPTLGWTIQIARFPGA